MESIKKLILLIFLFIISFCFISCNKNDIRPQSETFIDENGEIYEENDFRLLKKVLIVKLDCQDNIIHYNNNFYRNFDYLNEQPLNALISICWGGMLSNYTDSDFVFYSMLRNIEKVEIYESNYIDNWAYFPSTSTLVADNIYNSIIEPTDQVSFKVTFNYRLIDNSLYDSKTKLISYLR